MTHYYSPSAMIIFVIAFEIDNFSKSSSSSFLLFIKSCSLFVLRILFDASRIKKDKINWLIQIFYDSLTPQQGCTPMRRISLKSVWQYGRLPLKRNYLYKYSFILLDWMILSATPKRLCLHRYRVEGGIFDTGLVKLLSWIIKCYKGANKFNSSE